MLSRYRGVTKRPILPARFMNEPALDLLGPSFARAYRVEETPCFADLLRAIDDADEDVWRSGNMEGQSPYLRPRPVFPVDLNGVRKGNN